MTKTNGIYLPGAALDCIGGIGGWAPGQYTGKCRDCGANMIADKRASQCFVCAVIAMRDAATPKTDPVMESVFKSMCAKCEIGEDANFRGTLAYAAQLAVKAMRDRGLADRDILMALVGEARAT